MLLAGWLWEVGYWRLAQEVLPYPILQPLAEHRVRVTSGMRDGCSIVISVTVWRIRIIIEFRGL